MVDAATKEQADEQPVLREDKDAEELKDDEVPMDVDDDDMTVTMTLWFTDTERNHKKIFILIHDYLILLISAFFFCQRTSNSQKKNIIICY